MIKKKKKKNRARAFCSNTSEDFTEGFSYRGVRVVTQFLIRRGVEQEGIGFKRINEG